MFVDNFYSFSKLIYLNVVSKILISSNTVGYMGENDLFE